MVCIEVKKRAFEGILALGPVLACGLPFDILYDKMVDN